MKGGAVSTLQAGLCRELRAVDQAIEYNKDNIAGERFVPGDSIHDALYLERDEILLTLRYHRR
jgi:hypothetical protein